MNMPVIGVTTYNQNNKYGYPISAVMHKYISAISNAGGAVLLIPSGLDEQALNSLEDKLDGILFTGGGDVSPKLYNTEDHPSVEGVDSERDATEIKLAKSVGLSGKPFLGICRGVQVINVAFGGTLYTHISAQLPNAIKHDYDSGTERELLVHEVLIETDTRLSKILNEDRFQVNSLHHQGVKDLAHGFRPAGYAPDGLLEAIELPGHPFGLAVQWHPEWMIRYPTAKRLFRDFVEAASKQSIL